MGNDLNEVILKSKNNRNLQIAMGFAIVIILFFALNYINSPKQDATDEKSKFDWKLIVGGGVVLYILFKYKKQEQPPTQFVIIKDVADQEYKNTGVHFDTSPENVKVQRGGVDETYVEFIREGFTFLYINNLGVAESYPNATIQQVKEEKQNDTIAMALAKAGITTKTQLDKLRTLGLIAEKEDD